VLLIDDRVPPFRPPADERREWEPDPRTLAWSTIAIVLIVAGVATPGFASFALLCAGFACGAHALTRALPYGDGLREHRQ
jgi:hypothetical protein